jgi:riboflavin synthase
VFTGIVEEIGTLLVREDQGDAARLQIRAQKALEGVALGDSIAVNGVCLTVTAVDSEVWSTDVMAETLRRSSLGALGTGDPVNLERAVTPQTRLGGHLVQGHVDGTGNVESLGPDGTLRIEAGPELLRYLVEKGSIAVDGVSLTVAEVDDEGFTAALIPETLERTTLGAVTPGRTVNLEVDVLAKYVEKLVAGARA